MSEEIKTCVAGLTEQRKVVITRMINVPFGDTEVFNLCSLMLHDIDDRIDQLLNHAAAIDKPVIPASEYFANHGSDYQTMNIHHDTSVQGAIAGLSPWKQTMRAVSFMSIRSTTTCMRLNSNSPTRAGVHIKVDPRL